MSIRTQSLTVTCLFLELLLIRSAKEEMTIKEGGKFVMIDGPFVYENAKLVCEDRGSKLAAIHSAKEQGEAEKATKIFDLRECHFHLSHSHCSVFIGYKKIRPGSQPFRWLEDNSSFIFWEDSRTNLSEKEFCVNMSYYNGQRWEDVPCSRKGIYMCEFSDRGRNRYTVIQAEFTFDEASVLCRKHGGRLAVIQNEEDFKLAKVTANQLDHNLCRPDGYTNNHTDMHGCPVYIGYRKKSNGSSYRWIKDNSTFTNWFGGRPSLDHNKCVSMNYFFGAKWIDIPCNENMSALCDNVFRPLVEEGKYILIPGTFSFEEGQKACKIRGTDMATIYNEDDRTQAKAVMRRTYYTSCLRHRQNEDCSDFRKTSMEHSDILHAWIANQLNVRKSEDKMSEKEKLCSQFDYVNDAWTSQPCSAKSNVLCGAALQPHATFVMIEGHFSFEEGMQVCQSRGGDIAVIHNNSEFQKAIEVTQKKYFPGCRVFGVETWKISGCSAYIGYKRDRPGGHFKWIRGDSHFTRWHDRQPDNAKSQNEDCTQMNFAMKGEWNDIPCYKHHNVLCDFTGKITVTTSPSSATSPPGAKSSSASSPPVKWKNTPKITKFTTGEVEIGKMVRCSAKGHSPPHVIIAMKRVDGLFIEASIGVNKTEYKVPGDIDTGSHVVTCIAVNSHGSDTKNSTITIKKKRITFTRKKIKLNRRSSSNPEASVHPCLIVHGQIIVYYMMHILE